MFRLSFANKDMMSKILIKGIKFPDSVENIVGKEETAHYWQFFPFPPCFQELPVVDALK